ncbi:MAG: response regulator [Desulfovibrionaceae bacterium]|jgi:two-component system chemotaxis response regulator CheY|nr:response regulator [Desulfovibrionaceae bacterium]
MLRLLIVDDCPTSRLVLCAGLRELGRCDEADGGVAAVRAFAEALAAHEPYDVVLMDIMMPDMDGLQAAREIAALQDAAGVERCARAKMIMVSCLDDSHHVTSAHYECDADYYIPKPVELPVLHEALVNLGLLANPLDAEDGECGA